MIDHQALLPHRGAIMLVDTVGACEPGRSITTYKAVTHADLAYADLPVDAPAEAFVFPPTLILESFVQSGAVLWLSAADKAEGVLVFAGAKNVVFHQSVLPGDLLRHEVRVERVLGDNVFLSGEVWVGTEMVAKIGSVAAAVRPPAVLDQA